MVRARKSFLLSLMTVVVNASQTPITLDPIVISDATPISENSFSLDPQNPISNAQTLSELLSNEGLGTKVMKGFNEETIYFRGLSQDSTLFMIDDIPMYKTVNGSVNTNLVGLSSLSSVNINRGEATTLNGIAPIGGVISLTTKKPRQPLEMGFKSTLDPLSHYAGIYIGSLVNDTYITFNQDYSDSDGVELSKSFDSTAIEDGGKRLNSDNRYVLSDLKIGHYLNNGGEVSIRLFRGASQHGIPPYIYNDATTPYLNYERIPSESNSGVYASYDSPKIGAWRWKGRLYGDKHEDTLLSYTNQTYSALLYPSSSYEDYRYGGLLIGSYKIDEVNNFSVRGLSEMNTHNHHDGSDPTRTFKARTTSISANFDTKPSNNTKLALAAGYEELTPIQTYQWDNPADPYKNKLRSSLSAPTWQIATYYEIDPKSDLSFSVGSKVKMPSLNQFFPFMPFDNSNVDLKEERSRAYDVAYEKHFEHTLLRLSGFWYDIKNKIDYDWVSSAYYNINEATIRGIEFFSKAQLSDETYISLHHIYTDAKDESNHRLDNTPPYQTSVTMEWIPDSHWLLDALVNYNSYSTFHDGQMTMQHLNAYEVIDLKVSYKYKNSTFIAGVRNLTDCNYQTSWGYPQAGRTPYLSYQWVY